MCISCDAGMCRSYFHVTCAQKEGLLSEAAAEEVGGEKLNGPTILPVKRIPAGQPKGGIPSIWNLELNLSIPQDIADPFFAYCKQHADRFDRKWKRKNYLALQSYCKVSLLEREKQLTPEAQVGWQIVDVMSRFFFLAQMHLRPQARITTRLQQYRAKAELSRNTRPQAWVPREKLPRPLTSSASAIRKLMRKAELMGISTDIFPVDTSDTNASMDGRRKHKQPALTADFVNYYLGEKRRYFQSTPRFGFCLQSFCCSKS